MNKKIVFSIFLIILILGTLTLISFSRFNTKYKSANIKIISFDDYGYAQADDGLTYAFKGRFNCEDKIIYNNYDLSGILDGKSITIEYRITDEGENKIEKFWLENISCNKIIGRGEKK